MRRLMMKKVCVVFLFFTLVICFGVCANENKEIVVQIDISSASIDKNFNAFQSEMRKHYDSVQLGYIRGKNYSISANKNLKFFIIDRLSYYGIKGNNKYLLGYVTADGIYDKDSCLLKKLDVSPVISLGLSSMSLNDPWTPCYALQDPSWDNEIFNSEVFAFMRIDFVKNSLIIHIPEW